MSNRYIITPEEALGVLATSGETVDVLSNEEYGSLVQVTWAVDSVKELLARTNGAVIAGPRAAGKGFGVCLDRHIQLYAKTDADRLAALEDKIRSEPGIVLQPVDTLAFGGAP